MTWLICISISLWSWDLWAWFCTIDQLSRYGLVTYAARLQTSSGAV